MSTTSLNILFGSAVVLVIAVSVRLVFESWQRQQRARGDARLAQLKQESIRFLERMRQSGKVACPPTNVILQAGEIALLDEASILYESRAYRVGGGAGTRIGGMYIGGGVSESQQRLKEITQGRVTLTNERLIFDGSLENRTLRLPDIVSVEPWSDAIEVNTQRRAKSLVIQVANPILWTTMVEQIASGKITASPAESSAPKRS